jgi:arginyl-tRNA synthetase
MQLNLHDIVKKSITKTVAESIQRLGLDVSLDQTSLYKSITTPPDLKLGHYSVPMFLLAKELKTSPAKLATDLASVPVTNPYILEMKNVGPYLNIFTHIGNIATDLYLNCQRIEDSFFKPQIFNQAPKTMIEFSQPNTHKELHVGHMRNLCLGDALVKIMRYCNHEVIATTFPGDVGTHVAKCLWYYKYHNQKPVPEKRKGAWLGELYTLGNNLLEDQKGTPQEEENRKILTLILKQLEEKKGEYFDLWKKTREWSVELMQDVYKWANVNFDVWYWESQVDSDSVKLVQDYYAKGLFVKDDGAIGIDLTDDGLGFCLLIKRDGNGLYATKDIELARRKFQDHKIQKNIYVVDDRQSHHFKQVFKVLEKMGFEQARDCFHLKYDMVELPDGAMSSRKGNIVPLQSLIDQMTAQIKENYLNKYKDSWSQSEIKHVAHIVASGAIKYGMTKIDNNKKIVFDMDEWLKLDGDSGPYIQYVHARIKSMIEKLGGVPTEVDLTHLQHPLETAVILKIANFNNVLQSACEQYKTGHLTSFLYELSKNFNSFYAECSIQNAATPEIKNARLALAHMVALTIQKGLSLLGIEAPERM